MRIWTLWARHAGEVAPVEIATEAVLRTRGSDPEEAWARVAAEAKTPFPEVTDWFTRIIDVAEASIINDTDATIVGAVVPVREVPVPTDVLEDETLRG